MIEELIIDGNRLSFSLLFPPCLTFSFCFLLAYHKKVFLFSPSNNFHPSLMGNYLSITIRSFWGGGVDRGRELFCRFHNNKKWKNATEIKRRKKSRVSGGGGRAEMICGLFFRFFFLWSTQCKGFPSLIITNLFARAFSSSDSGED